MGPILCEKNRAGKGKNCPRAYIVHKYIYANKLHLQMLGK